MIEIDENIVGIWFMNLNGESDWMAGISRTGGGKCRLVYRFRYYETAGAWDGLDRKVWSAWEGESAEKLIDTVQFLVKCLQRNGAGESYELLREPDESVDQFMKRFRAMPWAHRQEMTAAEARAKGYL